MKKNVIIDCDPGLDDLVALLMALKNEKINIKVITAVAGNENLEKVGENILKLLDFVDMEIPVALGKDVHAVDVMAEIIRNSKEKTTIVALGPLTNVAKFIIKYPNLKDKIEGINFMGGAIWGGNITKNAEFNIFIDPVAADIVFKSQIPLTMCGLDVTRKAYILKEDIEKIRSLNTKTSKFIAEILESLCQYHKDDGVDRCDLHDPVAIISLTNPELIQTVAMEVEVDTEGKLTKGMTIGNFSERFNKNPNMDVAVNIHRERFIEVLIEEIKKYE